MLKIKRPQQSQQSPPRQLPAPRPDSSRSETPREAFSREFFARLEDDLVGEPVRKSVSQKASEFRDLEHEFVAVYARLVEIMRAKELLRAEIVSDLTADRIAMEGKLKELERLSEEFCASMPALPAPAQNTKDEAKPSVQGESA